MRTRTRSPMGWLVGACALFSATVGCRRPEPPAKETLPQVSGTIALDDVKAPVGIVRDRWGVPHIYAANQDDLFFAQGFVQAQDRLFQMDLWRRSGQGRLSEVLGANFIERDAMTRRVQYRGDVQADWNGYGRDVQSIATAFVRGINAWVDFTAGQPSEEFSLAGWRPERWRPEDLLNRTDAFVASTNASTEVFLARLMAALGERRAAPALSMLGERPVVPRELDLATISPVISDALRRVGTAPFFSGLASPLIAQAREPVQPGAQGETRSSPDVRFPRSFMATEAIRPYGGSAWAVSGSSSKHGAPLLAVEPHEALAHPSAVYLVHLSAPGWNVIGSTPPWRPGVLSGHNDRLAWGVTPSDEDVQDLYVERVNPANPHEIGDRDRWTATERVSDPIVVKGRAKPFDFEREYTRHGVLIASDRERHLAFTLAWTGFESGAAAGLPVLALDRARSVDDIQAAAERWKLPASAIAYATTDGRLGSLNAALVPMRRTSNGRLPQPGWSGRYDWQGETSVVINTGQNAVVNVDRKGAPGVRIGEVLQSQVFFDVEDFMRLQHDVLAPNAARLVPLLERVRSGREDVDEWRRSLLQWNRQLTKDSPAATVYVAWERQLLRKSAEEKIPADLVDDFVRRAEPSLISALVSRPASWFGPRAARIRDELLVAALESAVDDIRDRTGGIAPWGALC